MITGPIVVENQSGTGWIAVMAAAQAIDVQKTSVFRIACTMVVPIDKPVWIEVWIGHIAHSRRDDAVPVVVVAVTTVFQPVWIAVTRS